MSQIKSIEDGRRCPFIGSEPKGIFIYLLVIYLNILTYMKFLKMFPLLHQTETNDVVDEKNAIHTGTQPLDAEYIFNFGSASILSLFCSYKIEKLRYQRYKSYCNCINSNTTLFFLSGEIMENLGEIELKDAFFNIPKKKPGLLGSQVFFCVHSRHPQSLSLPWSTPPPNA